MTFDFAKLVDKNVSYFFLRQICVKGAISVTRLGNLLDFGQLL